MYELLSNLRHEVGDARLTARTQRLLMLDTLPEVIIHLFTIPTISTISTISTVSTIFICTGSGLH